MTVPYRYYRSLHRDRTTLLLLGGVALLLLGCIALMVSFFLVMNIVGIRRAAAIEWPAGPSLTGPVGALVLSGGAGAVFSILGLGALLRRRWFQPLLVIFARAWLLVGLLNALLTTRILPLLWSYGPEAGASEFSQFKIIGAVLLALGVVMPGFFLLLFSGRHVKSTLERYDSETRWTDRVPTEILGLSMFMGAWALVMLVSSFQALLPVGGSIVTGDRAVFICLASAVVIGATAVGLFRRREDAWWGAISILIIWGAWCMTTIPRIDFEKLLAAAGLPPDPKVQRLAEIVYQGDWFRGLIAAFLLVSVGYFFHVRQYLD